MATTPNTTPPDVTYRFVINATIDGHTAPLSIEGASLNEIRRAVRLLASNGMLAAKNQSQAATEPPQCPVHHKPMKPSKKPGTWFCSARVDDGYCDQKVG